MTTTKLMVRLKMERNTHFPKQSGGVIMGKLQSKSQTWGTHHKCTLVPQMVFTRKTTAIGPTEIPQTLIRPNFSNVKNSILKTYVSMAVM